MTAIVGQPATGSVTFLEADGVTPFDPAAVTLSSISPIGNPTPYVYGTDAGVTKTSAGVYALAFLPTAPGAWLVIGDGFDVHGNQVAAAISAPVTVGPRLGGTPAQIQALAVVEQYIKPWTCHVISETARLFAFENGILTLPGRPVIPGSVVSVTDVASGEPWLPVPTLFGNLLHGRRPEPAADPVQVVRRRLLLRVDRRRAPADRRHRHPARRRAAGGQPGRRL